MLQVCDGCVARFEVFVGLDSQLRDLSGAGQLRAATPVAITPEGIHVGQYPAGHNKIGLLTGLAQEIEPDGDVVELKAYQKFFRESDMRWLRGRILVAGDGLDK
jgi:hypothetical protein